MNAELNGPPLTLQSHKSCLLATHIGEKAVDQNFFNIILNDETLE